MDAATALRNAADAAKRKADQFQIMLIEANGEAHRAFLRGQMVAFDTMDSDLRILAAAAELDTATDMLKRSA